MSWAWFFGAVAGGGMSGLALYLVGALPRVGSWWVAAVVFGVMVVVSVVLFVRIFRKFKVRGQ